MSLKSRIEKQGYRLVHRERLDRILRLQRLVESFRSAQSDLLVRNADLNERIIELEAEVEAYKRVATRFAERALTDRENL